MKGAKKLLYGGNCYVPKDIAVCPECGSRLKAVSIEWLSETGIPTTGGLEVSCKNSFVEWHRYWQSDWQSVINQVEKWCGAVEN
jgi:hypothetical protein